MDKALTRTQKSARNTIFAFLLQLVNILSNFVIKTAIVKLLGVEYSGLSTLFSDVLMILSLTELGFGTATGYALYKPLHEKDKQHIADLMAYYRRIYMVVIGALIGLGLICMPFIRHIVTNVPNITESIELVFFLYVLKTASSYLFIYKATLLEANQDTGTVSKVSAIALFITSLIEILVLVFTRNYIIYLISFVFSIASKNIAVSIAAGKKFPYLKSIKARPLPREERKDLTKNVGALAIYKICGTMQRSIDSVIISAFIGTDVVGYLASYRLLAYTINDFFGQVLISAKDSIGNLAVSESKEHQYQVYNRLTMLSFLIGNCVAVSLFVLLTPFIKVWLGPEYVMDLCIPAVIAADVYILVMARPYEHFRTANALFIQGKYRPIVMSIINIVLSLVLCKLWGVFGVLFATVVARASTHSWYDPWLVNKHVFKHSFKKYLLVKLIAVSVVVINAILTYYVASIPQIDNYVLSFIVKLVICLIIPNLTAFLLVFRTREFAELKVSFKNILHRK